MDSIRQKIGLYFIHVHKFFTTKFRNVFFFSRFLVADINLFGTHCKRS